MTDYTWSGSGDGTTWSDPNNWGSTTGGGFPGASDNATINTGASITGGGSAAADDLTISAIVSLASSLSVDDFLSVSNSTFTVNGGALQTSGPDPGFAAVQMNQNGAIVLNGGTFQMTQGGVNVGFDSSGSLTIQAGGVATFSNTNHAALTLGFDKGGNGTVTVTGNGSTLTTNAGADVGASGDGYLYVQDDGLATFDDDLFLGGYGGSYGEVDVGEAGSTSSSATISKLTVTSGPLVIGAESYGEFYIYADGNVAEQDKQGGVNIAADDASTGDLDDSGMLAVTGNLTVGDAGLGTMEIENGGQATAANVDVAAQSTSGETGADEDDASLLTINGAAADGDDALKVDDDLTVGDGGYGGLNAFNGALITTNNLTIAAQSTSGSASDDEPSYVALFDDDTQITVDDELTVGEAGYGQLTIKQGAKVTAKTLVVAAQTTSGVYGPVHSEQSPVTGNPSNIYIADDKSSLTVAGTATVGDAGYGDVDVWHGGSMTVGSLFIASQQSSGSIATFNRSFVEVDDAGSTLTVKDDATVGYAGYGFLTDFNGGAITIDDDLFIASESTSGSTADDAPDVVAVDGNGSKLHVGGDVNVGYAGFGALTDSDGAKTTITGNLFIAAQAQSETAPTSPSNYVQLYGDNSALTVDGFATVGELMPDPAKANNGAGGNWTYTGASGVLYITDDSSVAIGRDLTLQDQVDVGADGAKNPKGGITVASGGSLEVGGTGAASANTLQVADGAYLSGHGQIIGSVTGDDAVGGGTTPTYSLDIDNEGTIRADDGVLALDGNASGGGQYLVGDDSTLEFGGKVDDDVTAMFLPGDDETIAIDDPENFKGVISSLNFGPDDKIDLPNVPYVDPGSADLNPDGASLYFETGEGQQNYVLQVVEDDQAYDIPISEDDDDFSGGFTLTDDGHGGTLVTDTDDGSTGYSVTAAADGPRTQPYLGIVQLGLTYVSGDEVSVGNATGFYIAKNFILTNAHVLKDTTITKIVAQGQSGNATTALSWKANPAYSSIYDYAGNDFGIIYVPTASPKYIFPLSPNYAGKTVDETGYSGFAAGVLGADQVHAHGMVKASAGEFSKDTALDLKPGSSGSPFYTNVAGQISAVGLNSSGPLPGNDGGGKGVRLTTADLSTIKSWESLLVSKAPIKFYNSSASGVNIVSAAAPQGDADSGQTVQFNLNLSQNVTVTGAGPMLTLNDGGVAIYNAANSTGTELEFDYTVGAGDQTNELEITGASATNTVQGPGASSLDFSELDGQPTNLSINSPLTVASFASLQIGEVGAGAAVQLILTMSEAVNVDAAGGAPMLLLDDNATATYDAAASSPSAGKLVFDYTVGADDATPNLEITSVDLPSGTTITDAAGDNANFSAAVDAPTGLQVGPAFLTAITPSQSDDLTTGQTLKLTLTMSQAVTVDTSGGSPTLSLSDGADATYDDTASNPSAGTLVFDYTVAANDYTTDLQILGYNPDGSTITDARGVAANLSAATDDDLALDVNAAVVTGVAALPSTGEADSGQQVTLTLTMNEPIDVNLTGGSPTLSLDDGATATYDDTASDPSTGSLVFDYTVGANDQTPDLGISDVNLNGATIDDASGHAADLSAAASFTTNLQIGSAFVSAVAGSLTGDIFTGQTDQITLTMSQAVTVNTTNGSPMLSLSDGASATYDDTASDPSTGALVFNYTVGAGDYTTDLAVLGYIPNGATVTDANGVSANFAAVGGGDDDLYTEVNAAIVTDVTASPSTGEVDSGAKVTLTLTMSDEVVVNTTNGAPTLSLSDGATATYDSAASNPTEGSLVFDYTVGATDETDDLSILQTNLNGATIDDASGHAADLSAAANIDTGLQIGPVYVDSVTPSLSGDITTAQMVQFDVTMSQALTLSTAGGSPTLSLSDGAVATYDAAASDPSDDTLVFDYTVAAGDYAVDLSIKGFNPAGSSVTDANGVNPDFSGLIQSYLDLDINATTVVGVAVPPSTGPALYGQQVQVTLTLSGPVTVNTAAGSPTLYMSDGAIATYDAGASDPSTGKLVFGFTVGRDDYTPNLQIAKFNLHGSTITDANGNVPDFSAALGVNTDLAVSTACYGRGTNILTDRGEVAIEALELGNLVITAEGDRRPIVWIGHRRIDVLRHPEPQAVRPIRVAAGAFGEGLPRRDLWLSPGHNVAFEGALIPISALVNGRSVAEVEAESIEYWHVELETHEVILADGLPAESYLDCGNRTAFANGGAFAQAHPDFIPKHWADTCLPLATEGLPVARATARLLARLTEQGHCLNKEADPHLLVDDLRVEPIRLSETRLAFAAPAGGRKIALCSNVFTPAHTVVENKDRRLLGLCVGRLQIDGATVALNNDDACGSGWHDAEFDERRFSHRWTNGAAPLPAGARIIVVDLAGVGNYWRAPEFSAAARFGRYASVVR